MSRCDMVHNPRQDCKREKVWAATFVQGPRSGVSWHADGGPWTSRAHPSELVTSGIGSCSPRPLAPPCCVNSADQGLFLSIPTDLLALLHLWGQICGGPHGVASAMAAELRPGPWLRAGGPQCCSLSDLQASCTR